MEIFRRLKEKYPSKFILASIMGKDEAEWEILSRLCEENGSDALEFILLGAGRSHRVKQKENLQEERSVIPASDIIDITR